MIYLGLFFLGTILTGGLVSIDKPLPKILVFLHKITPYLTVLSTCVTLYIINITRM